MRNRKPWVGALALVLALVMTFGLVSAVLPQTVSGASLSELEKQLNALKDQKKEIDKEIKGLKGQLSDNLSDMQAIVKQKGTIDQEIFMLHEQTANLNEQIATYVLMIADKQEELDEANARLAELNIKNKQRIRAMEEDGAVSYWSVLFKANSFADLLDRLNMVEEIAASDQRRLKEMSAVSKQVEEAKIVLEKERTALEESKAELVESEKVLEERRAEADKLLAELISKGEEYQKLLDKAEDDAADLKSDIKDAQNAYNDKKEEQNASNNSGSSSGSAPSSSAKWIVPCKYKRVSSAYGWRIHPVYGYKKFHYGVDLAASSGTPIKATRAGTVTVAKYSSSAGYYVTLDHGDGFSSQYMHMTHYIVKKGQKVDAGQVIGYVGSTGASTGPHLHFSILYKGSHVNPAKYIKI
ncbi:MAG: peptidoglycan DD-metalloendopeptidase family protein [Oscillospiraceae bacterium]|nr:peptidoglycan DD-metalloendopeptidase family protein [Oscillospiraceae bacterium]MBQ7000230.1 peptidoglycan DD-metalloendopeptidase family protein [Oscillospiraceae bacterium]